ncbi:hypothetical protein [Streptomyces sp. CAU 1734]|uniref:hypothetical protein n=1 Tax=Streptomyces sp. CAU 1734 TaxID=3140360 RepID=UPI003261CA7C
MTTRAHRPDCLDCYGTGRRENLYYHRCDRPGCRPDLPTVECECADEPSTGPTVVFLGAAVD